MASALSLRQRSADAIFTGDLPVTADNDISRDQQIDLWGGPLD